MISSDYSLLGRLVSNSASVRDQLAQTQEQISSGLVSDTYSGLGTNAQTSLSLAPAIAHQTAYSANINMAQGRLDATQSAMTSISTIASQFFAQVNTYNSSDTGATSALAQQARAALQEVGNLLNTQSGDVYVFAGQDTDHAPVPNTDPAVISSGVLNPSGGSAPFSTTIGSAPATVQVGAGQTVQVGLLANANTLATSTAPTTGSYMRDLLTGLAKIAGLTTSADPSTDVSTARSYLNSSISAMATETGSLGNIQSNLTARQTQISSLTTALSKQLSGAEDVDAAAAISKAALLQTQLTASYQIIASTKSLSLANYL